MHRSTTGTQQGGYNSHAVVMGGSIAGLCAAAALAKNFDRVTLLERDSDPGQQPRRGVPQGNHAHGLLCRGQKIMDSLFPGMFERLAASGGRRVDLGTFRWFLFGGWKGGHELGMPTWLQSRPLLEHHVRESVRALPNVELRFDCAIDEPIHEGGRVRGVRTRDGEVIEADLVIDATGRGSRSPGWLEQWGYGRVQEQQVSLGLAYVSGVFEVPANRRPDSLIGIYQLPPDNRRSGLVVPIEDGRVLVTLMGYHGDHAPTDIDGFRSFARGLMRSNIYKILRHAKLVGKLTRFNYPMQVRRCYGAMRRLPNNYLIIGDAMCSLDPTFGQGMGVSAMEAEALTRLRPGMSTRRWQAKLARITDLPFAMTANEAHRWPETTGWQPAFARLQRWYIARLFEAASGDDFVYRRVSEVMHLVSPRASLFTPRLIARLLVANRRGTREAWLASQASSFDLDLSSSALSELSSSSLSSSALMLRTGS